MAKKSILRTYKIYRTSETICQSFYQSINLSTYQCINHDCCDYESISKIDFNLDANQNILFAGLQIVSFRDKTCFPFALAD